MQTIPEIITKTQATGNDFVMFEDADGQYDPQTATVARLCDRHFGIGADGLIRVTKPKYVSDISQDLRDECAKQKAQWFMDYRNADGSLAQMCGNGTRATTRFILERHLASCAEGEPLALGTRAGVKFITPMPDDATLGTHLFRVDMGAWKMGEQGEYRVQVASSDGEGTGTFVDMGNPHIVSVVEDAFTSLPVLDEINLAKPPLVTPALDEGQNVEFVRIDDIDDAQQIGEATMRVYERGCGETFSCGTGLCATAIVLRARTGIDHWIITVRGGVLRIDVTDNNVLLTGSAELVADCTVLE